MGGCAAVEQGRLCALRLRGGRGILASFTRFGFMYATRASRCGISIQGSLQEGAIDIKEDFGSPVRFMV